LASDVLNEEERAHPTKALGAKHLIVTITLKNRNIKWLTLFFRQC
jgi:hypothetical protein